MEWKKQVDRFTAKKIANLVKKKEKGYLLEVDVEYPAKLHDTHNDLPFMPEKMEIGKVEKLVPNLWDKDKYVVHIRALDQVLKHGLVLNKVHRVISFQQSACSRSTSTKTLKLRKKQVKQKTSLRRTSSS